jgi:hypothetical protein
VRRGTKDAVSLCPFLSGDLGIKDPRLTSPHDALEMPIVSYLFMHAGVVVGSCQGGCEQPFLLQTADRLQAADLRAAI